MYICIKNSDKKEYLTMKITKRSNRRLPAPLELSFYLFAVIVFCVINWTLLKSIDPGQRNTKSFESMIVEEMLKELPPVTLSEDQELTFDVSNFAVTSEHALKLEPWMINLEAFFPGDTENEIALEDWMINTSAWTAIQY
jgi:hypothetical protein